MRHRGESEEAIRDAIDAYNKRIGGISDMDRLEIELSKKARFEQMSDDNFGGEW